MAADGETVAAWSEEDAAPNHCPALNPSLPPAAGWHGPSKALSLMGETQLLPSDFPRSEAGSLPPGSPHFNVGHTDWTSSLAGPIG